MFTGLVETRATIAEVRPEPPGKRLVVHVPNFAGEASLGESVAVNGCCLTVVEIDGDRLAFEAGPGDAPADEPGGAGRRQLRQSRAVATLERPVGRPPGHRAYRRSGHTRSSRRQRAWSMFWFRTSPQWTAQMVAKGSIAVDGVSLTLVDVEAERFSVALIPHTLDVTTLGELRPGDMVNLETDLLAKYVQKQLAGVSARSRCT